MQEASTSAPTPFEEVRHAYYRYVCLRKLRLMHLTGAHSTDAIATFLAYAARALLGLIGAGPCVGAPEYRLPEVSISVSREYMLSDGSDAFVVGRDERSRLNSGTLLGVSATSATALLDIEMKVSALEWDMLMGEKSALLDLILACDLVVPLAMNFRVFFSAHPEDWSFRLPSHAEPAEIKRTRPILGITSALASG